MHIYSHDQLYNNYVHQQTDEALSNGCISSGSHQNILNTYKRLLYTPNYFIRIAIALLTIVAVVFAALLAGLIVSVSSSEAMTVLLLLLGVINYAALEMLVTKKHYYNAGVDNVLMFSASAFFVAAFTLNTYTDQSIATSLLCLLLCGWMAIRFADLFMAMLAYVALLALIFLLFIKMGSTAKATVLFVIMLTSAAVYFGMKNLIKKTGLLFYRDCFKWVMLLTLLSFYAGGNYYVAKVVHMQVFHLDAGMNTIPFGWLFWIFTWVIPPAYVAYGLIKKDMVFIRTGLILCVVSILTYRYYYAVLPVEQALLLGGLFLVMVGYLLTRYLKTPKLGFVFSKAGKQQKELKALQELLLVETAGSKPLTDDQTQFGGGDFGGGGAGGRY